MQCSNARLLSSGSFGHLNDFNNSDIFIAHPTSNQLEACSHVRSWTSASSLAFTTFKFGQSCCKQVKAVNNLTVASFKYNSAVGIFIRKLWALSFVISISKVHVFVTHNAAGFLWTSNLYLLLRPVKRVKLLTEKRTLKASFFSRKATRKGRKV